MPNHTENRVILSHNDSQQIDAIHNVMNTDNAELCHHLIPEPLDDNGVSAEGWYDWRCDNWGTKWDIYNTQCSRMDDNTLVMSFNTAWSPPIPIFDKLVDMGFEVDARYLDEGWMYIGEYVNGEDWSTQDVDNIGSIRPELDDEFGISQMVEEMKDDE